MLIYLHAVDQTMILGAVFGCLSILYMCSVISVFPDSIIKLAISLYKHFPTYHVASLRVCLAGPFYGTSCMSVLAFWHINLINSFGIMLKILDQALTQGCIELAQ